MQVIHQPACKHGFHETKFGNGREPLAASLSAAFKLIAYPRFGKDCEAFKDKAFVASQHLFALIGEAQRQGAISAPEAQQALEDLNERSHDGANLNKWAELIGRYMLRASLGSI